ncbi:MAG: hypothetical protein AAGG38_03710 [Planctomycetota bacterium]
MSESHQISLEALDQVQQLLLKIPAHHRAAVQVQLDRASIYQHVLVGWDKYFDHAGPIRPLVHRMVHKLIATGIPSTSGSGGLICSDPGNGPDIQAWLGVGIKAGKELAAWLRDCPLIKPHPDLPGQLIIYGRTEDLRQGDAHPQLPLIDPGTLAPEPSRTGSPSGATAPEGDAFWGAIAPRDLDTSGAAVDASTAKLLNLIETHGFLPKELP